MKELLYQGEFQAAMDKITSIEYQKDISINILYLLALEQSGDYLKVYHRTHDIIKYCKVNHFRVPLYYILIVKSLALWRLIRFDECLEELSEAEAIYSKFDHTEINMSAEWKALSTSIKGRVYYNKGNRDQAHLLFLESLELYQIIDHTYGIAAELNNLGVTYLAKAEYELAISSLEEGLELFKKIGNKSSCGNIYTNLGNIHRTQGDLDVALKYYLKCLDIRNRLPKKEKVADIQANIASIYSIKGELEIALDNYFKCLQIYDEQDNERGVAFIYTRIGNCYRRNGEIEVAVSYLKRALKIELVNNNRYRLSSTSLNLFDCYLELNDLEKANYYLRNIEQLIDAKIDPDPVLIYHKIATALVLKHKDDRSKKAQELFESIIQIKSVDFHISAIATLNLCEILLLEFKSSKNSKLLCYIESYIENLEKLAEKQRSYTLNVQVYILKAKLAILHSEYEKVKAYLLTAKSIAKSKGLELLAMQVQAGIDRYVTNIPLYLELDREFAPIIDRYELLNLEKVISSIKRDRLEFLVFSDQKHKYNSYGIAYCGTTKENANNEKNVDPNLKCSICRKLDLLNSVKKIIGAHIMDKVCPYCYYQLDQFMAEELIEDYLSSDRKSKETSNNFLGISSALFDGKIIWRCKNPIKSCNNPDYYELELKEITKLFSG